VSELRVGFAPEALELIERIRAWWVANRPKNPRLFDEELLAAERRVATARTPASRIRIHACQAPVGS
jgi:hypothetical protein